ncbi:MAG: hypothetical protein ACOZAN_00495 [Patescibacteria group bacterium]
MSEQEQQPDYSENEGPIEGQELLERYSEILDQVAKLVKEYDWNVQSSIITDDQGNLMKFEHHGVILQQYSGRYELHFMPFRVDFDINQIPNVGHSIKRHIFQMLATGFSSLIEKLSRKEYFKSNEQEIICFANDNLAHLLQRFGFQRGSLFEEAVYYHKSSFPDQLTFIFYRVMGMNRGPVFFRFSLSQLLNSCQQNSELEKFLSNFNQSDNASGS